jgi:hypothetical protein
MPCANSWDYIWVSGLEGDDSIQVSWNAAWQGGYIGSLSNGTFGPYAFSSCPEPGEDCPDREFVILESIGYVCNFDDSTLALSVIVECFKL